ncbi:hypothetical protein KQX54_008118 [Cotesia glomerata]|uniref:Uncharacterized protein n=1 Tax=Cotesia glomerata TaxID=32391 RepID=A0AAV7IR34_COTGL|nr:hypothetical protein KQX54_008118 [Cotesia glomerata]
MLQVATRPWSPDQGKTREMTKLCNHKRKLLLPVAAASPVASCTPVVSSSTLPVLQFNCENEPENSDKKHEAGLKIRDLLTPAPYSGSFGVIFRTFIRDQRSREHVPSFIGQGPKVESDGCRTAEGRSW